MVKESSNSRLRHLAWTGYAAAAWSFSFAAVTFYWALGGTAGLETIGPALAGMAGDAAFMAVVWSTGVAKVLAGLLALALFHPWARWIPCGVRHAAAWVTGVGFFLYGSASFIQHALMLAGVVSLPAGLGETAARWHLLLWDPWWMLGGVLFIAAAWLARDRKSRSGSC